MKYRVVHRTTYWYGAPVEMAAHRVQLRPRELPHQRVLSVELRSVPEAAREAQSLDHFGNYVSRLFIERRHEQFEVTAEAVVDVAFPAPPVPNETLPWEQVVGLGSAGEAAEFTFASPMVPALDQARDYAAASFPPGRPVLAGLIELNQRIHREFRYRPGATSISTPLEQVLRRREGVCQDFAHLMLAALRALGLPARYVSGYIRTLPPAGAVDWRGADQSHAWIGAWLGPEHGWVDLDPTNDLVVAEDHVVLAWGRDFGDISPVRGIILGGGRHSLAVTVELTPLPEPAES